MSKKSEKSDFIFIYLQPTEKIIVSSSKLVSKLENLELLKNSGAVSSPSDIDFPNEPRPAYAIFSGLEQLILYSDDDDDFFMPVVDGNIPSSF